MEILPQVKFHYQTKACRGDDRKLVDDSKKMGRPMELVIGKKFKFEVWEVIVQKMSLKEVAKFHVDKSVSVAVASETSRKKNSVISFAVGGAISVYFENIARRWKTLRWAKALLWDDTSEWGNRIQGFGWAILASVRFGVYNRLVLEFRMIFLREKFKFIFFQKSSQLNVQMNTPKIRGNWMMTRRPRLFKLFVRKAMKCTKKEN